jgi:deazaflavin-dependent oxidoreductase (nitroreductase family)
MSAMNAMMKAFTKAHVWLYRSSSGKRGSSMQGKDIVLLTTKGRKTGADRTVPVVSFTDGADRIVVASKGGAPEDPAWFRNLQADPNVTVQLGQEIYRARAVIPEREERDRLWTRVVSEMPQFGGYEKKTTRVIPVVRLVRAGAQA